MTRKALIIVDQQVDFAEGGSLACQGSAEGARRITEYASKGGYDYVVATKDWHIDVPEHFREWPVHCLAGSEGAEFHPNLQIEPDAVFYKGMYEAAYSGFEGRLNIAGNLMADWLRFHSVEKVDICGTATDYCVLATALDSLTEGFTTDVITSLCTPVTKVGGFAALRKMKLKGVLLVDE